MNYGRRIIWLAVFAVLLFGGYSAGWFYLAGQAQQRAEATVRALNTDGRRASCENLEVRGFPFRIGVFCRSILYVDQREGVSVRGGALRTAAQIYAPRQIVAELDAPAFLELPGLLPLALSWESLRASTRIEGRTPERLSLEATNIAASHDGALNGAAALGTAESGEFHMRRREGDLDLAWRFAGARPASGEGDATAALPPLDGFADIAVTQGAVRDWREGLRGASGEIRQLEFSTADGASLAISGPASVRPDGLLDAQLQLTLRGGAELGRVLAAIFPEAADEIAMGFSALASLGEATTLPLNISAGRMRLGFFSIGDLPPL